MNRTRFAAAAAAVLTAGGVAGGIALAAGPMVTSKGAGAVRIGMLFSDARAQGLVGKARQNCADSDPAGRGAKLKAPLTGTVTLTRTAPRRIARVHITGGSAAARGVKVGDTLADAKAAFPQGTTDKSLEGTFELWFYRVPKGGGGKLVFQVEPTGAKEVVGIDVPRSTFCE